MKFIYPAVFRRKDDGSYFGYFPDLDGCLAAGNSLEEAVDEAHDAAEAWLSLELEEQQPLPPVSDADDLLLSPGEELRSICVTIRFNDGWDE